MLCVAAARANKSRGLSGRGALSVFVIWYVGVTAYGGGGCDCCDGSVCWGRLCAELRRGVSVDAWGEFVRAGAASYVCARAVVASVWIFTTQNGRELPFWAKITPKWACLRPFVGRDGPCGPPGRWPVLCASRAGPFPSCSRARTWGGGARGQPHTSSHTATGGRGKKCRGGEHTIHRTTSS